MTRQVACNGCGTIVAPDDIYDAWTRLASISTFSQDLFGRGEPPKVNMDLCGACTRRILSLLTVFPAATETTR